MVIHMEINVMEDKKDKIEFELDGANQSFCNALRKELWTDSHIKAAGYSISHPLIGKPHFIVETDGADTKKTLTSAASRIKKQAESFESDFVKAVK